MFKFITKPGYEEQQTRLFKEAIYDGTWPILIKIKNGSPPTPDDIRRAHKDDPRTIFSFKDGSIGWYIHWMWDGKGKVWVYVGWSRAGVRDVKLTSVHESQVKTFGGEEMYNAVCSFSLIL